MIEIQSYFPSLIGYAFNKNHDIYKDKLINECFEIKDKVAKGGNNWLSQNTYNTLSTYNLLENKNFLPIQNFIIESVNEYCDQLKIDKSNLNLRPSYGWFNIYYRYDYQEFHIHGDSMISTIYFLKCNDKSAKLIFKSTINEMSKIKFKEPSQLTFKDISILPQPGLLIIFDSSLQHCVEQHLSDQPRISLAYNFKELR